MTAPEDNDLRCTSVECGGEPWRSHETISSPLPKTVGEVSASWLQDVLCMGMVNGVEARPLGSVDGFTGQVARLALTAEDGLPQTLIAKFPNADAGRKAMFVRLGYAAHELSFYRTIASRIDLRVPRLYFGALDPETGDSILLLEDLGAPHCLGSMGSECSVADARDVISAIAGFHSVHWGAVAGLDWIPEARLGAEMTQHAFTGRWWPAFLEKVSAHTPQLPAAGAPLRDLGELIGVNVVAVKEAFSRPPSTIVHSDFRVDNIFRIGEGIAIIDWENIVRARGATDIGYFAITSLTADTRRQHEHALLDAYWRALKEAGVQDYTKDQCLQDYLLGIVNAYIVMVLGVVLLDAMSQRDPAWTLEMLRRIEAANSDHQLVARLADGGLIGG